MEFRLVDYPREQQIKDYKKLLAEKGLYKAVKQYCDMINDEVSDTSYNTHRTIQEYLCTILDLIDIDKQKLDNSIH